MYRKNLFTTMKWIRYGAPRYYLTQLTTKDMYDLEWVKKIKLPTILWYMSWSTNSSLMFNCSCNPSSIEVETRLLFSIPNLPNNLLAYLFWNKKKSCWKVNELKSNVLLHGSKVGHFEFSIKLNLKVLYFFNMTSSCNHSIINVKDDDNTLVSHNRVIQVVVSVASS